MRPHTKLLSIFIHLTVEITLFVSKSIYWQKDNFLLKINPKYHQVSLGYKIGPLRAKRLREEGLKAPIDLKK